MNDVTCTHEGSPQYATSVYAASKQSTEELVQVYSHQYGICASGALILQGLHEFISVTAVRLSRLYTGTEHFRRVCGYCD